MTTTRQQQQKKNFTATNFVVVVGQCTTRLRIAVATPVATARPQPPASSSKRGTGLRMPSINQKMRMDDRIYG
jgi:hypothetical protein